MRTLHITLVSLICALTGCATQTGPGFPDGDGPPCGVVACSAPDDTGPVPEWSPPGGLGKADAEDVAAVLAQRAEDGVLDADDVRAGFEAAGQTVKTSEMLAIRDALASEAYEVTDEARATALEMAYLTGLFEHEAELYRSRPDVSFGGHAIPEAVRELVARARLNGAIAYDVQERDDDGEGVWNPYPSTTPAVENMTFEYTEITPEVLAEDLAATDIEYNAIVGTEEAEYCDPATGECRQYRRARYERRTGGTGHVMSHYDEVHHLDIYARGSSGQRWANNCAILSDGSVHCLPASRRSVVQDVILTNPHLSRCNPYRGYETDCRHMLYHGHIDIRGGVVVGVEMSGRISKRAAGGKANFIDPLAVLEAWGFEISPGLTIRFGNTEDGVPVRDLEGGVVREASQPADDPAPTDMD